jgi:hypothetical protein
MNWTVTFYAALLFFILTPAVLVRLPPKGSKYTVAAFHALVFALVFHFTAKLVWQLSRGLEGFQEGLDQSKIEAYLKKINTPVGTITGKTPEQIYAMHNKNIETKYCENKKNDTTLPGLYGSYSTGEGCLNVKRDSNGTIMKVTSGPGAGRTAIYNDPKTLKTVNEMHEWSCQQVGGSWDGSKCN